MLTAACIVLTVVVGLVLIERYVDAWEVRHARPEDVARWRSRAARWRERSRDARREYDLTHENYCDRQAATWDAKADRAQIQISQREGGKS